MSAPSLYDNHGRKINYLRLAVTDRCNLRCFYCMPENICYSAKENLLTFSEMYRIVRVMSEMGIEKLRITGGEPFLRKGIMEFMHRVNALEGIRQIHITTNGTLISDKIPKLVKLGIQSVNFSLDSLDRERFFEITKRDEFEKVKDALYQFIESDITTKVNMVVMSGRNEQDIIPMALLTKDRPISVRYIEEMPFNGEGNRYMKTDYFNFEKIIETLKTAFPDLRKIPDPPASTSLNYAIPGHAGTVGVIPAFSRTFCGTCNRIRVTAEGTLKTCLYDNGVLNIRDALRNNISDNELKNSFLTTFNQRAKDGFEAEQQREGLPVTESMSTIGG